MSTLPILAILLCGLALGTESKSAFKCGKDWTSRETGSGVECYFFGKNDLKKYSEARDFCKGKSSKLAWVTSAGESDWIKSKRPKITDAFWLGYFHEDNKDYWNDKKHPIAAGDYAPWDGNAGGCISHPCDRGIIDSWGKWKKVESEYIHGAKPLCKQTEEDHSAGDLARPLPAFFTLALSFILSKYVL